MIELGDRLTVSIIDINLTTDKNELSQKQLEMLENVSCR